MVADGVVIAGVFPRIVAYSIDSLLLGAINLVIVGALGLLSPSIEPNRVVAIGASFVALEFIYFVGLWSSRWQASIGMRLLRLRVVTAEALTTLSLNDGVLRWLALSGALSILSLVPTIASTISLLLVTWVIALLITTNSSPLRQGLHDRWARSIVVEPAPGGHGAAIVGFLVVVALFVVIIPVVLLLLAGDQLEEIMSQVGRSI